MRTAPLRKTATTTDVRYRYAGASWLAPLMLAGLCIALQAGHLGPSLTWQRQLIQSGQWWRLLTGNFIHLGWPHLLLDLAGLGMIWLLFGASLKLWQWLLALLTSSLCVGVGLYLFVPGIGWYLGLSGALHGLYVAGIGGHHREHPVESAVLLFLIITKLTLECLGGPMPGSDFLAGGQVVTQAHLLGALGGLAFAALSVTTVEWLKGVRSIFP